MKKFKITTGILGIIVCMTGFYCTFNLTPADAVYELPPSEFAVQQLTAGLLFFTGMIFSFIVTFYPSTEFKNNLK